MLIIAIPKSASTALLLTIGKAQKLPWKQICHRWKNLHKTPQLEVLSRYHSDMLEYDPPHMKLFADPYKFYKQHIPPTSRNRALLRDVKKVILLREPKEIIEAYWRAEQAGIHRPRPEFAHCETSNDWLNTAVGNGLWSDLQFFHDQWLREVRYNSCIISYKNVVNHTKQTINKMEEFWGLPITQEDIVLTKVMYSRDGPIPLEHRKWDRDLQNKLLKRDRGK